MVGCGGGEVRVGVVALVRRWWERVEMVEWRVGWWCAVGWGEEGGYGGGGV